MEHVRCAERPAPRTLLTWQLAHAAHGYLAASRLSQNRGGGCVGVAMEMLSSNLLGLLQTPLCGERRGP